MKINGAKLENFMLFDKLDVQFSPNVNIICGENSTGKTALIKMLYACATHTTDFTVLYANRNDKMQNVGVNDIEKSLTGRKLHEKIAHLFGVSIYDIHELTRHSSDEGFHVMLDFGSNQILSFTIYDMEKSSLQWPLPSSIATNIVYIPTKEMISATDNFASLYRDYHISFDETYYDLCLILDRPRKKTLSPEMEKVVQSMEALIGGKVIQKGKTFYLDMDGVGELRMSLVSEGYRKLATLLNLVSTGSLSDGSILFWDEPETNMNPRMIEPLVKAILALAGAGVQVFVTTHDYFVQQYFGLAAEYGEKYQPSTGNLEYRFLSLNKARTADGMETVTPESASRLTDLEHNAIAEEFDSVYDREQGLIYGDNA